jgi:DNA excision repair protein ERCC-2
VGAPDQLLPATVGATASPGLSPSLPSVAVRTLCEFAAKAGDLDSRFTPAPTAQEGQAGHKLVAARRGASHRAEVPVDAVWRGTLHVRGRADGFDLERGRVEEVKTFKGDLARMPANHRALHWAQAKAYGWLLCQAHGLARITVVLVYLNVRDQQETLLEESTDAATLEAFFDDLCGRYQSWGRAEQAHRLARDAALRALSFPLAAFRPGQRTLAEAVYKAVHRGHSLMAQAPTGIGKTLGTLFPALKAMPGAGLDKLHFLTAKGPGRKLALDAAAQLRSLTPAPALPLRVLELVARDKACVHPDRECHGQSCPRAQGFYDRLAAARADALAQAAQGRALDADTQRTVGDAHTVCPYYLGQELARWADVVIGDYNHFFDSSAMLYAMGQVHGWRAALLLDEAHNLIERARGMYSAVLDPLQFAAARKSAPAMLKRPLGRLHKAWLALAKAHTGEHATLPEPPAAFASALRDAVGAISESMGEAPGESNIATEPGPLRDFFFDALLFTRLLDDFGSHALFDLTRTAPPRGRQAAQVSPGIRNLLPAPHLGPRWAAAHGAVLFSATLAPHTFYADTLGLPSTTAWLDVPAPFRAEQLDVTLVRQVSTRWRDRAASVRPIASLIARQFAARPGNYLAFFSSFDYLEQVADELAAQAPEVSQWRQARAMGEAQRTAFLGRFAAGGKGVGFAVLGGVFAEGIDLPGSRLIGAFIATLGLPQVNPLNEAMRRRLEERFGAGYDYTYLYPGLRKVVQAAGRVIRTPDDEGTVYLIDDRFARAEVRRLLPAWWQVRHGRAGMKKGP